MTRSLPCIIVHFSVLVIVVKTSREVVLADEVGQPAETREPGRGRDLREEGRESSYGVNLPRHVLYMKVKGKLIVPKCLGLNSVSRDLQNVECRCRRRAGSSSSTVGIFF